MGSFSDSKGRFVYVRLAEPKDKDKPMVPWDITKEHPDYPRAKDSKTVACTLSVHNDDLLAWIKELEGCVKEYVKKKPAAWNGKNWTPEQLDEFFVPTLKSTKSYAPIIQHMNLRVEGTTETEIYQKETGKKGDVKIKWTEIKKKSETVPVVGIGLNFVEKKKNKEWYLTFVYKMLRVYSTSNENKSACFGEDEDEPEATPVSKKRPHEESEDTHVDKKQNTGPPSPLSKKDLPTETPEPTPTSTWFCMNCNKTNSETSKDCSDCCAPRHFENLEPKKPHPFNFSTTTVKPN